MQKILFATNRKLLGMNGAMPNFGDVPTSDNSILCGLATVEGTDSHNQDSGVATVVTPLVHGAFAPADIAPLLHSTNDVLVLIHGAGNSFSDSMTRASYNQKWLSEIPINGAHKTYDIIAFTWPARRYVLQGLAAPAQGIADYEHDRSSADASNVALAAFFKLLYQVRSQIGARRMHLLAHSMGCFALGGGVEKVYKTGNPPAQPLFDKVILAAGDEISSTFTEGNGGRLSNLYKMGRGITVYFNRNDILMHLSGAINFLYHLGYEGPPNKADVKRFSSNVYAFVDCDRLTDYNKPVQIDYTHQYYRETKTVRNDIAVNLAGLAPQRPKHDVLGNYWSFV